MRVVLNYLIVLNSRVWYDMRLQYCKISYMNCLMTVVIAKITFSISSNFLRKIMILQMLQRMIFYRE